MSAVVYPKGWDVSRDGSLRYEDDWESYDSWTANRRTEQKYQLRRPRLPSGRHRKHEWFERTIRVRVNGGRGKNDKLRARNFYVSIILGGDYGDCLPSAYKLNGKCKSVADAIRKVESSPVLAELERESSRRVYCTESRQAVYCRILSIEPRFGYVEPDGPPIIEPFLVAFSAVFNGFDTLRPGRYVRYSWERWSKGGTREWRRSMTLYDIDGSSCYSGASPKDCERFLPLFPEWFSMPTESP